MSNIIKKKRIFETVEKLTLVSKVFHNPYYNQKDALNAKAEDWHYDVPKLVRMQVAENRNVRTSRITYLILCPQCKNESWVKRKDAQYCSAYCRRDAYQDRKEALEKKDKKK